MKQLISALILATAFYGSVAKAVDCEGLLVDPRYGLFSQRDVRTIKAGLIRNDSSNLCGPTCLVNSLAKIRAVLNLPPKRPATELAAIITKTAPRAGLDPERIVEKGISAGDLAILIRSHLNDELKIPAKVDFHWVGTESVTEADLLGSATDRKIVILLYSYFPITNPTSTTFRHSARTSGHYVIVGGDPVRGILPTYDSYNGLRSLFLSGTVTFSDQKGLGLWLRTSPSGLEADSMVASAILTIELTGD